MLKPLGVLNENQEISDAYRGKTIKEKIYQKTIVDLT